MRTGFRIIPIVTAAIIGTALCSGANAQDQEQEERQMGLREMIQSRTGLDEGLGGFPVLETGRIRLREVRPREDAAHWHSLLPDSQKSQKTVEQIAKGFEGVRSRFYGRGYVIYWAITLKDQDKMIGNIRYWEWAGHPECPLQFGTLMYDLAAPYAKDKALAAEALRAAAEFGLGRLHLARVQCTTSPDDSAREKALLAAGFQKEGILRNWWFSQGARKWEDEAMFSFVADDKKKAGPEAEH
jgi:ribosomal-protein-alanine N-acetyltransferase